MVMYRDIWRFKGFMVLYMCVWWFIEVYGDEKRYMVMYRGAWCYTWMYGDV